MTAARRRKVPADPKTIQEKAASRGPPGETGTEASPAGSYDRSLIEASLDPLVTISPDGAITDVNAATAEVTGCSREELIGTDFSTYFTDPQRAKAGYESAFRTGSIRDYELEIRHASGRITSVIYNATVYLDEAGEIAGVFAAARDISKRKKAEEEWSRLVAIVDSSDDAIIGKSLDGTIVSWNPGAEKIYGYAAPEAIGRHMSLLAPPGQVDEIDSLLARIRRGESVRHYETIRVRRDGTPLRVSLTLSPIRDRDGRIVGASTIARDITARKQAEEAVRRANAYNRSLIEASLDPLVTIDPDGTISDVSDATVRVTGRSREELIGTDFSTYFTEPWRAKAGYETAFRTGSVRDFELELRHRDGTTTPVIYNATVYRDEAGEVAGVFAAARDITERKKAEEAIRRANAYNRSLIEASLDPLVTINPDGTISDVNEATIRVTGVPRDGLIGTNFSEYFTEPERAKAGYEQVFHDGSVTDYELEIRHRDGRITPVLYNAAVYRDESGGIAGIFAAARDVTERKRAEAALLTAYNELDDRVKERTADLVEATRSLEREITGHKATASALEERSRELARSNEELQQFAYIASHDLQEPLRAISGFTELLERRYKGELDERADRYINFIVDGTRQMQQVIQDLLAYSRVQTKAHEFDLIDTNRALDQALLNLRVSIRDRHAHVAVEDRLPEIFADGIQITQVFQNLIGNALKFQKPGAVPEIRISTVREGGDWVFSVADNGIGIDARHLDRIFMLFQRLHAKGEYDGTGIGLAICKRIVERHGGSIAVQSTPGLGSTFTFSIPTRNGARP
ncbi:MAG: PAS domain S-box protein [Methanospirillum sp.]